MGVLSTSLTDDGPVYHALGVHICRATLITRFDDRYAVVKFSKSGVPAGSTLIFGDTRISLKHNVGQVEESSHQLDLFSRFDRTPNCDGQTDTGP